MRDVLVIVDLFSDFRHEDGERLLASLTSRHDAIAGALDHARRAGVPVVFVNDRVGPWDSDAPRIVRQALAGPGAPVLRDLTPRANEQFVVKPRYSAFDHTALAVLLEELGCERVLLAGMSTEGCVAQSAIDARELGYKVSVLPRACATVDEELETLALRYLDQVVGVRLDDEAPAARTS